MLDILTENENIFNLIAIEKYEKKLKKKFKSMVYRMKSYY